ncbi:hypothetical protein CHISP_2808 [Chitinispirillum alkaliphilum]|nr:hypothetical protein CHISP_2808 [Chitinispirillum alkaliphilum]
MKQQQRKAELVLLAYSQHTKNASFCQRDIFKNEIFICGALMKIILLRKNQPRVCFFLQNAVLKQSNVIKFK